jgi:transcriptional regulator with XRE-family HTH domain
MKNDNDSFGIIVRAYRRQSRMTLEQVGKAAGGLSKGYMSGIENNKVAPPSPKVVTKISRALGLRADLLLLHAWVQKAPEGIRETKEFKAFRDAVKNTLPTHHIL